MVEKLSQHVCGVSEMVVSATTESSMVKLP